jgi:hypothetical protein
MGCIRVDKITEYLCEPLRKCLKVIYSSFLPFNKSISILDWDRTKPE